MKLTLKQATLENFKGVKKQVIDFGKITNLYAANEKGKSRIYNAYLWGLTGKDSRNRADYEIKTRVTTANKHLYLDHKIGEIVHKLEYSVELVFDCDGRKLTLKRILKEKWVKARDEFKANTTEYLVNGVEGLKKVYDARINELIPEKLFRILTDTKFFNSDAFGWVERRKILTEIAGQDDETKLDGYSLIKDILDGMSTEDRKKTLKTAIKKIKEQQEKIEPAINENEIKIKDYGSKESIESEILKTEGDRDDIKEEIDRIKADSGVNEIKNKIEQVKTEKLKRVNEFDKNKAEKIKSINDQIFIREKEKDAIIIKVLDIGIESTELFNFLKDGKIKLTRLQSKYVAIKSRPESINESCPTCKQDLPTEKIEEARNQFNLDKSNFLEENKKEGEGLVREIKIAQVKIAENSETIKGLESKVKLIKLDISGLEKEKSEAELVKVDFTDINTKISEYQKQLDSGIITDTSPLETKIAQLELFIDNQKETILNIGKNQEYRDRIKELKNEEKTLSQKQANLEKQLKQIQEFIFAKTAMVESAVNGMFEISRFRMFNQLGNGETEEICETLKDGIPYNSINKAGRVQVGVDIPNVLQKFYNIHLPMFVDDREGVTNLPKTDLQMINLFVSPEDVELRIETED